MNVYVHHNPGSVEFNATLYMFVRSWYVPTELDEPPAEDTWFRVPAYKTLGPQGRDSYVPINSNLAITSMLHLTEEGLIIKAARAKPYKSINDVLLNRIKTAAIDIPEWEYQSQESWPYAAMFKKELVRHRYIAKYGETQNAYFDVASMDKIYMEVRRSVLPKPCGCKGRK